MRDAGIKLGTIVSLGILLIIGYFVVSQPVNSTGLTIRLQNAGYLVTRVVPGSPAEDAGLRTGDRIITVGDLDARELYRISRRSIHEFLAETSLIFSSTPSVRMERSQGDTAILTVGDVPLRVRLLSVDRVVLSNLVVGVLLVLLGAFFALKAPRGPARISFVAFCTCAGPAIALSFFHSLWSFPFLTLRFSALTFFAAMAMIALVAFAATFPATVGRSTRLFVAAYAVPPVVFLLLAAIGAFEIVGESHFFVHGYVVTGIVGFLFLLWYQYRTHDYSRRRRLRWVFLGSIASITPFLVYLLSNLARGTYIEYAYSGVFNQVATFFLLLFPFSIGVGLTRYEIIDVDTLTANAVSQFLTALVVTLLVSVLYALTAATDPRLFVLLLLTAMTAFGKPVRDAIHNWSERRFLRRHACVRQGVSDLTDELSNTFSIAEALEAAKSFATGTFNPVSVSIIQEDVQETHRQPREKRNAGAGDQAPAGAGDHAPAGAGDHAPAGAGDHAPAGAGDHAPAGKRAFHAAREPYPSLHFDGSGWVAHLDVRTHKTNGNASEATGYHLVIGPRHDGDIFSPADLQGLQEAADLIADRIHVLAHQEELARALEAEKHLLADKNELLREVHHRVKNNLQIMESLVNLQRMHASSAEVKEALKRTSERIHAIALVHAGGYHTTDLSSIDMERYLSSLIYTLAFSDGDAVAAGYVEKQLDKESLPVSHAIPCGLILVELLKNAIDHGAPGITVVFRRHSGVGLCELSVSDSGSGIDEPVALSSSRSTGFMLINAMANQMQGELVYNGEAGATFCVYFDDPLQGSSNQSPREAM